MSSTTYLQVRLDNNLKSQTESVLKDMGLTMTQAVKLFFKQVTLRKAIPFSVIIPQEKRAHATPEEEALIEQSLNQIKQGKAVTIDMSDKKQVKKHFG